jgi:catechol 2,3-dioxygenase-like lactoylglutathione lyase family enzyme
MVIDPITPVTGLRLFCIQLTHAAIKQQPGNGEIEKMNFNKMIPELSVFDIDQTIEFYKSLGFELIYERPEDRFAFLSFEGSQFMFEQLHSDGWNTGEMRYPLGQGINFSITTDEIDCLYARCKEAQVAFYRDLMITTYRVDQINVEQKEFLIQDPNGYLLRFTN